MNNDATKKIPGEGFKRPWPPCGDEALGERRLPLIKMAITDGFALFLH
jgi:hypothetical protein